MGVGGTVAAATLQRVGPAALPPDIRAFGDEPRIVFRRSRSTTSCAFVVNRVGPLAEEEEGVLLLELPARKK